jgi:membrane protease subunit HflC
MSRNVTSVLIAIAAVLVLLSLSLFTVDQRQNAIVFRLGEPKQVIKEPGLFLKVPLVDNVRYFDVRILTLDSEDPERIQTTEKKNVLVDSFVKFRISDVLQYYISVGGDEPRAKIRLAQSVNDALRAEFGKRTIQQVVSGERAQIMEEVRQRVLDDVLKIGITLVDVRLKRVDLPQEVSEAVYRRMEAERKQAANKLRSDGFAEAEKTRADADKQREVIIAEAYRDAQRIKGDGDAKASAVYASTFQQNPEFFAFYRSIEAYRQSFRNKNDVIVLDPSSDFFKYLKDPGGRRGK